MSQTYKQTGQLKYSHLRVPKDEAYFVYLLLNLMKVLGITLTLDESLKGAYRDIEVKCPIEFSEILESLIKRIQTEIRLDILEEKIISDF